MWNGIMLGYHSAFVFCNFINLFNNASLIRLSYQAGQENWATRRVNR